ncbi:MAG: sulfite exporter TauE/SafE family protein [Chloroflexota bacterium]
MDTNLIVLLVIGFIGGVASGLLGIGGGIIMVPLLAYVGGLPFHSATTISIAQVFVGAVSGVQRHYRLGTISPKIGLVLGVGSAFTAAIASIFSPLIPALYLQIAFIVLLLLSGGLLLVPKKEPAPGTQPHAAVIPVLGLGMLAGAVTGTLGAGGGFFMVPLMIYGLGLGTKTAIGTSLAAIVLGSLSGVISKFATGQIDLGLAAVVVTGGAAGAQVGAYFCNRLSPKVLRRMLLGLLVIIAVRTLGNVLAGG